MSRPRRAWPAYDPTLLQDSCVVMCDSCPRTLHVSFLRNKDACIWDETTKDPTLLQDAFVLMCDSSATNTLLQDSRVVMCDSSATNRGARPCPARAAPGLSRVNHSGVGFQGLGFGV